MSNINDDARTTDERTNEERRKPKKEERTEFESVYAGLSPLAAQLLRNSAAQFDEQQRIARERSRFQRNLAAAKAGLAQNDTWGEFLAKVGAL